ncbi:MAG: hypothetical protein NDJ89_11490 [Oligoflexia bacterium]|nr:hypothetical protein [Oligoflexia bacterium]
MRLRTAPGFLITLVYFAIWSLTASANGYVPGILPGSNASQQIILFAWKNLARPIELCLIQPSCGLTSEEKSLLLRLYKRFPTEFSKTRISFEPESSGLFKPQADSAHRIAVTGNTEGSPIIFNADAIAFSPENPPPVDLFTATAILVHELGHHQGMSDTLDRALDQLGAKVQALLRKQTQVLRLDPVGQPQIQIWVSQFLSSAAETVRRQRPARIQDSTQILLTDGVWVRELTYGFENLIPCARGETPVAFWIHPLKWDTMLDWDPFQYSQPVAASSEMYFLCNGRDSGSDADSVVLRLYRGTYRLAFYVQPDLPKDRPDWWNDPRRRAGWWKSFRGIIDPASPSNMLAHEGADLAPIIAGIEPDNGLQLLAVKANATELRNGDTWSIQARVRTPKPLAVESCEATFSSDQFLGLWFKARHEVRFTECRLAQVGPDLYDLKLGYTFPGSTVSRNYFLQRISFKIKGSVFKLSGTPALRQMLSLRSAQAPAAAPTLSGAGVYYTGNGQTRQLEPSRVDRGISIFTLRPNDAFYLLLEFTSSSPLLPQSGVLSKMAWYPGNPPRKDREYDQVLMFYLNDQYKAGPWIRSVTRLEKDAERRYSFLTTLPWENSIGLFRGIRFFDVYLINEELQETHSVLPFVVEFAP